MLHRIFEKNKNWIVYEWAKITDHIFILREGIVCIYFYLQEDMDYEGTVRDRAVNGRKSRCGLKAQLGLQYILM